MLSIIKNKEYKLLSNLFKEFSKDQELSEEQIEGIFSSFYFTYSIFSGIFEQIVIHTLFQSLGFVLRGTFDFYNYFFYIAWGSSLVTLGFMLFIVRILRKTNVTHEQFFKYLKIAMFKDKYSKLYKRDASAYLTIKNNIRKYAKIIKDGKNESLKKMVEICIINIKDLSDKDILYLDKKGYLSKIKEKYKESFVNEIKEKVKKSYEKEVNKKLTNF